MSGPLFAAVGFVGLLAWGIVMAAVILHDVIRHQPQPGPAATDRGAMSAQGVPYVPGPKPS